MHLELGQQLGVLELWLLSDAITGHLILRLHHLATEIPVSIVVTSQELSVLLDHLRVDLYSNGYEYN